MFTYKAQIVKVVDGDTVDVDIDLGFQTWVRNVRLRLNRIDAYETRLGKNTTQAEKELGLKAKYYIQEIASPVDAQVAITTTKKGKYGRWIAELVINGENISDKLVELGYAVYREY